MGILDDIGITGRSAMGGLYQVGLPGFGPDGRFLEDLQAIDDYVRTNAHPAIAKYPGSASAVADYDKWRQGLGTIDLNWYPNDVMANAKAKRYAIQSKQGGALPNTAEVEPGSTVTPPDERTSKPEMFASLVSVLTWGVIIGVGIYALSQARSLTPRKEGSR